MYKFWPVFRDLDRSNGYHIKVLEQPDGLDYINCTVIREKPNIIFYSFPFTITLGLEKSNPKALEFGFESVNNKVLSISNRLVCF